MAVDTRNKRASCLGIDGITRQVFPNPDGAIGQPDRQHVAYKYAGIAASAPGGGIILAALEKSFFRFIFGGIFGRVN